MSFQSPYRGWMVFHGHAEGEQKCSGGDMQRPPLTHPTRRHLEANIGALDIHLTPTQIRKIDKALPFDYGQPMSEVSYPSLPLGDF